MSRQLHAQASRVHKWLALIIGAQLLLWFASGSVMSILPIETVRSEHLVSRAVAPVRDLSRLISPAQLPHTAGMPIRSLRYRMLLGQPVAEITAMNGEIVLADALTGERRHPIDASEARRIAEDAWLGDGAAFTSVEQVTKNSVEYRGPLPAWRVSTGDNVSLYIPAATGVLSSVRSPTWRFYDFFWSLHIMDWTEHENFNSWWLIAFALGGLAMAISGVILLVKRFPLFR